MEELTDLYAKDQNIFKSEETLRTALASTSIDLNDAVLIQSLMDNRESLEQGIAALYANEQAVKAET
jgi:hypothetical protein